MNATWNNRSYIEVKQSKAKIILASTKLVAYLAFTLR